MDRINLAEKFALFAECWSPKIVGRVNDVHVKLARLEGAFEWHSHASEDELFLVVEGRMVMRFRDRDVTLEAGEMLIVPRGVDHLPVADAPCEVLLVEPISTVNTGDQPSDRTIEPEWI